MEGMNFLNPQQLEWLTEQIEHLNLVVVTIHGSHLYGLEREGSDIDIKVVYYPTIHDMVVRSKAMTPKQIKNDELDIEVEIKPVSDFLNGLRKSDTNSLDILFTPESHIFYKNLVWDYVVQLREFAFSKEMKGIIGYIKTHASKYSHKIQRYEEVKDLLEIVKEVGYSGNIRIQEFIRYNQEFKSRDYKFIKVINDVGSDEQTYLEVLGKKHIQTWGLCFLQEALEKQLKSFGQRTLSGSDMGVDGKSMSHALRVLAELEDILDNNTISFPIAERDFILDVKLGKVSQELCVKEIDERFDRCMAKLESSTLPEKTDVSAIETLFVENMKLWL